MSENMAPTGQSGAVDAEVEFSEIDWAQREREDEELMSKIFENDPTAEKPNIFGEPGEEGEKADDAVDYGDLSDDDDELPDEEEASGNNHEDVPGLTDDYDMGTSHDTDDLFGDDGRDSSPIFGDEEEDGTYVAGGHTHGIPELPETETEPEPEIDLRELNFPGFRMTNQDPSIPATAESEEELIKQLYPSFEKGITLDWNELMPPRMAYYNPKVPAKPPKVLNPTKISLEVAPDQEKSFRSAGPATTTDLKKRKAEAESKGLIPILEDTTADDSSDDGFDWSPLDPNEPIAGTTMGMIGFTCADWESAINAVPSTAPQAPEDEVMDDWDREILGASSSKRKAPEELDYINAPRYPVPYFDNYEQMTAHIAKKVVIDLNDPNLLVEKLAPVPAAKRRRLIGGSFKRVGNGGLAAALHTRFNFSNDEAYNALKENHQSKVRATLANEDVEHSLPALKLLWPYYKVKLDRHLARTYHRPYLKFAKFLHQAITFSRGLPRKRKEARKLPVQEIFKDAKDLTLAETQSHATLIEYSEEHPNVLSNFGMGNRITSYYRRKDGKDMERPKIADGVGDTHILLAEDKSPFSNFGFVDPGETVRTIHNGMYRAPIFKHEVKGTDFLVIRSSTGVGGTDWFIRTIDHLFVAGQQFPVVEIPGPHSRKVTNAAKNRMRMVALRKIKHSPASTLKISEITAHIADSSDMQNRQKLKEFLQYDKGLKVWKMRGTEVPPDEANIRTNVSPEDVCLIDAMQVGDTHLTDAGYAEEDEEKEAVEGAESTIDQDLAPWKTSKAFLEASADKAMLQLHGDGDPSGCGQAFSMIKTSMKGGYIGATKGAMASSASASEELRKQNNGHVYNVKKQQDMYNEAIRNIWEKHKASLSNAVENADLEDDRENENEAQRHVASTPRHMATPAAFDDNASQFSVNSRQGRAMRIIRTVRNPITGQSEESIEVVRDVRVWREYQRRVHERDAEGRDVYVAKPTGNPEFDKREAMLVKKELARLERNKERRTHREAQKNGLNRKQMALDAAAAAAPAGSTPSTPAPSTDKPVGTTRKCANCGNAGHIKTNKKLCPMLNGTLKMDNGANLGGFGAIKAPSFP